MPQSYDQVPLGQMTDPLSMPDNSINYADVTRFQMISQYQQQMQQYPRSSAQYTRMLSQPRFQYGTNGQDTRFYQRQAEVSRNVYGAGIAKGGADIGSFMGVGAGLTAMGVGGFIGSIVAPMAVTAAPLYFINKGIERTLERQRAMQSIASDVEQYRDRIGMSNMSYGQASQLGMNLTSSMFQRGQYFDPVKQQEILKYGLANDMLSGKGRGMVGGDVKTFEKNFKELMETVKTVTKTMKVTAEGAMSVVKEMQMGGFGTMGQIGGAITSAKAFGSMTGLGMQNMLQIGAAGAQAAQGGPYWASSGAAMYMGGAAIAGSMAKGNDLRSMKSVEMAGGVAQAGGIIAQTQMNIMQSGMGARVIASVMNANQQLNPTALSNFLQGTQSGHNVVSRASQIAHGFGTSRVMFQRNREEIANQIAQDSILAAQFAGANFNSWRSNRRGTREEQAQAYAQTFVQGGQREQNVYADALLSGMGIVEMSSQRDVANSIANERGGYQGLWSRAARASERNAIVSGLINSGQTGTERTQDIWSAGTGVFSGGMRKLAYGIGGALESVVGGTSWGKYGLFDRRDVGNTERGYKNLLGLNPTVNLSPEAFKELGGLTAAQRSAAGVITGGGETFGWNSGLISDQGNIGRSRFYQTIITALSEGGEGAILENASALRDLGISKNSSFYKRFKSADPLTRTQVFLNIGQMASKEDNVRRIEATKSLSAMENLIKANPGQEQIIRDYAVGISGKTKDQLAEEFQWTGAYSIQGKTITAMRSSKEAALTIAQLDKTDTFMPGSMASYEAVRKASNKRALEMMGMAPGQNARISLAGGAVGGVLAGLSTVAGIGLSPFTGGFSLMGGAAGVAGSTALAQHISNVQGRRGLARLAGVTEADMIKDPAIAVGLIAQKISSGALDIYDPVAEKKLDPEKYNRQMRERRQIQQAFGIKGEWDVVKNTFREKFGNEAKDLSDNMRRGKAFQAIVGKNEAALKFLSGQGVSGEAVKQLGQYLDVSNKSGILGTEGGVMSAGVAQTIASNLLPGTTSSEIQKMAKSGELVQRMYYSSKTDVGATSRIKAVKEEIDRISNLSGKVSYKDFETGKQSKEMGRDAALEILLKKFDLEQKVQGLNETTENSKGKSMNSVIASPVLNYWNNKWSM